MTPMSSLPHWLQRMDLDTVSTVEVPPYPGLLLPSHLLNGMAFFERVALCTWEVDVISYTATRAAAPLCKVRRLIYQKGDFPAKEKRQLGSIHTKLYLGIHGGCAWLGSQNLVVPTGHNLMVEIRDQETIGKLQAYFEHFWEGARP